MEDAIWKEIDKKNKMIGLIIKWVSPSLIIFCFFMSLYIFLKETNGKNYKWRGSYLEVTLPSLQ
ncbi:hypothetical protein MtrunA17_Chr5g0418561 [Medicago truncatula]|uniref:Uncharacterized protein n=1 Tax=Medicago truncatula TaxID=3880 RepID=A0A396HXR9_MEDTR|nr:hypothetical protein MtrunA17_Chr5g0418561 [Medicago truncatula]